MSHGAKPVAMAASNPLDRLREQRAARMLELLQSDLRARVRVEKDAQRSVPKDQRARRQARIARLEDPVERQRLWTREPPCCFEGVPIRSLPKAREFWLEVDVTTWTKRELDAACVLLDLPTRGKKRDLLASIQDWVLEPELLAQRRRQEEQDLERDVMLGSGRVFAFGSNFHGELGLGHRLACDVPTEIESFRGQRIMRVESGFDADFAFATGEDGRVFAWGGGGRAPFSRTTSSNKDARTVVNVSSLSGDVKQLEQLKENAANPASSGPEPASLSTSCFLLPQELPQFSAVSVQHLACGRSAGHIALATTSGECFTWGKGEYGELGVDLSLTASAPTGRLHHVRPIGTRSSPVAAVSVGNSHTVVATADGGLFAWGGNWSGQLGVGAAKRGGVVDKRLRFCFPAPTAVEALSKVHISRVSCGAAHTGVVSADGQLFMFGCGDGGRLGLGSNEDTSSPQLVTTLTDMVVLDVCCGSWHSLCLATQRSAKPATSSSTTSPSKRRISGRAGAKVTSGDGDDQGGYVYSFGSGLQGQLGLGKQKTAALPTCIPALQLRRVQCRALATSSLHCCALSTDGGLYTWGDNVGGCLGRKAASTNSNGGSIEFSEPELVDSELFRGFGVGSIVSIAAGRHFTVFATGPLARNEEPRCSAFEQRRRLNALSRELNEPAKKDKR